MSLTRLVAETSAFATSVVLARLISPSEFGLTALGIFLFTLAASVSQQGFGSFLVQRRDATTRHFEAATLAALVTGLASTVLVALLSVTIAPLIFGTRVADLGLLASPSFFLAGAAAVPVAQLQRRLGFARLGLIQASASVVGPGTSVVLAAAAGLQAEALILGSLVAATIALVLSVLLSRPPRPAWHAHETRQILAFGVPASGSSMTYAALRNVDYLLLAAFMPSRQVGLYMRAFTLGSDWQAKISTILVSVAFPVLSSAKDLGEIRRVRARMIRVHATILLPLLFGLIAVAPEFVPWMYGERWGDAAPLTQILALGGMLAAVGTGTGPLLMATGHTRALLAYTLIALVVYSLAVLVAIPFGITAVCVAVVIARFTTFVSLQYLIVERRVGIPVLETVRDDVVPAIVGGFPLMLVTMLGMRLCLGAGVPVVLSMLLPGICGLIIYAAILRWVFPATWSDLARLLGQFNLAGPIAALKRRRAVKSSVR